MRTIRCSAEHEGMRVLIVEDEPYLATAIRDGLRLEARAAQ
jgi:two-component system response regulator VanR